MFGISSALNSVITIYQFIQPFLDYKMSILRNIEPLIIQQSKFALTISEILISLYDPYSVLSEMYKHRVNTRPLHQLPQPTQLTSSEEIPCFDVIDIV